MVIECQTLHVPTIEGEGCSGSQSKMQESKLHATSLSLYCAIILDLPPNPCCTDLFNLSSITLPDRTPFLVLGKATMEFTLI